MVRKFRHRTDRYINGFHIVEVDLLISEDNLFFHSPTFQLKLRAKHNTENPILIYNLTLNQLECENFKSFGEEIKEFCLFAYNFYILANGL